ncbi:MAG: thioether cross-link-forming SCIFF peptide maturase [Clostridiales Family XIII bacterium]|jgi:uncharacterized protein|nr:thioether cross-link-forming SCIFF peptide maturase [Clostridiales Family XIII bacterium]
MIHLFTFKDLNIVTDTESGAVHVVSGTVYDMLSAAEHKKDRPFCVDASTQREAKEEIEELVREGLLFSEPVPEELVSPELREPVIKAMCLHIAHDCNMRCAYCFAGTGEYSGERSLLPAETGRNAIDFLLEHSGTRRNLEIDFFGGEPLMNFGVVRDLVRYGRERERELGKHIRFTLTTNGLLLDDENSAFINEHMDNVILSIDGRPEVNDRVRRTVAGGGTYEHIIGKLRRFVKAREKAGKLYYVRGTYTAYNKDFAEDVAHLASLGFGNVSVEPVVTSAEEDFALTEADIPELCAEYDRLADLMIEREKSGAPLSFFHFNIDLSQGPCVFKRAAGCGAGTEYVAVAANGDLYPCHQFVGEPAYLLGNVNAGNFENRLFDTFNTAHIFSKPACRDCWAKYWCSGGCHANAVHMNGDILRPHELVCALERKRLECAIGLAALAQM